jgi:response regulator RpfG family c-di-GMP phosphodiesterase
VRCFADPPTAEESAAVFATMPKGPRRVLTLSDDVEAFIDAKTGLAKAGHSVSMACDSKQALDLLAMFTPDAVFIDLRTAPTAAAEFLAALAPESGRVLVVLVHGDPAGNVLPCVIQRLLRPTPLDPADLVSVCRNVLAGPPATGATKSAPVKAIRPFERPKAVPRAKPAPRRLVPRRR